MKNGKRKIKKMANGLQQTLTEESVLHYTL